MTLVLGVDGCPRGWCAVAMQPGPPLRLSAAHHDTFAALVAEHPSAVICVDIPIGLLDGPGQRGCDRAARALLGRPRASSVFPPPCRCTLDVLDSGYAAACDANCSASGKRITQQAYHIASKIREVDSLIKPSLQDRILETHPEVCFHALAGRPMLHRKSRSAGRTERWAVLRGPLPLLPEIPSLPKDLSRLCGLDDYLDALVCAWTAVSVLQGTAQRLPESPGMDQRGLRMEIWHPGAVDSS